MRSKEPSTNVFFVRHGQTDFPHDRIYCDDREDPPLNRNGIVQAKNAALYFKELSIDAIYSSPSARTRATAKEISEVTGVPVQVDARLRERGFGVWEGLYTKDIETRFPSDFRQWKEDQVGYTPDSGETIEDLASRLRDVMTEMISRHANGLVIVVSHVGPIRISVCQAFAIPLSQFRQINVDNASITQVNYGKKFNNLIRLNNIA